MKRESLHISMPQPCHERWDQMDATARGAFCHSCSKEVIDFSIMTDHEVIEFLAKHKTGCGKFRNDQVERPLVMSEIKNGFLKWKVLLLTALSAFSFKEVFATHSKEPTDQSQTPAKTAKDSIVSLPKIALINEAIDTNYLCPEMISGKVVNEENEPIASVRVQLADEEGKPLAPVIMTDRFGCFCLTQDQITEPFGSLKLCVSEVNYYSKEIDINTGDALNYTIALMPLQAKKEMLMIGGYSIGLIEIKMETYRQSIISMPELPLKDFF